MTPCERCGADTKTGQYLDEQIVYICDDCYGEIGPRDDFEIDDVAAALDRDRAADEVERHGTT